MTSSGYGWPRLRQALDERNLAEALSAAAEMEYVGLVEALELVLLLADDDNEPRFERAALRWARTVVRQASRYPPR